MARPSDRQEATRRGPDLVTRIVWIALVVYLAPVLLATFAVGLIAMALHHLTLLTTAFFAPHHRATTHRPPAVVGSRIGRGRTGTPPFA